MKTKKLLAFVMASAMVLSMAACGGSSSSGNSGSSDAAGNALLCTYSVSSVLL